MYCHISGIFFSNTLNAQEFNLVDPPKNVIRKNSFYAELGGIGVTGSINYDRIVRKNKKTGIVLRVGVTSGYENVIAVVGEANYIIGRTKHFIELGVGTIDLINPEYSITFRAGYRYQGSNGFLFRAALIHFLWETVPIWPGFSFGYSF